MSVGNVHHADAIEEFAGAAHKHTGVGIEIESLEAFGESLRLCLLPDMPEDRC